MSLTRSHLSLIITGCSLSIVVLTLFNIHLGAQVEEEYVIEMQVDVEDLTLWEELAEPEAGESAPIESHMAHNETAKPSLGQPEPLKTLQEILEERAEASDGSSDEYLADAGDFSNQLEELSKKREEVKEMLGEQESEKTEYTNYLKDRRTSISYSLVDRNAHHLPPPIYTCIEGGRVVINIEVDARGFVTQAEYNAKSSGTSNGCLVDNAITYALQARFSDAERLTQKGTITYIFQSK